MHTHKFHEAEAPIFNIKLWLFHVWIIFN